MTFRLRGDVPGLRLPPQMSTAIGSELWRHTCFETFIAIADEPAYHEFNFAPSGEWAAYEFRGYRDGRLITNEKLRPEVCTCSTNGIFELKASVRLDLLSDAHAAAPLSVGMSAVVESRDGFSYWALRHPREKPDFHHRDGFALHLESPSV
jgi:hypothetical protein